MNAAWTQYQIRCNAKGGGLFTGGHQTLAAARRRTRQLIADYGYAVTIVRTDGRDEEFVEVIEKGSWR